MANETLTEKEVEDLSEEDQGRLNSIRLKDRARRGRKNAKLTVSYQITLNKYQAKLSANPDDKKAAKKVAQCEEALRNIAVHRHPMGEYVEPSLNDASIDL